MSDDRVLRLHSRDLLSKWGFNDGSMPDDVFGWLEDEGVDRMAVDWDAVLRRLVRGYLLPVLGQRVHLYDIEPHNPIRAATVNGTIIDDYDLAPAVVLTPAHVDVPYFAVIAAARGTTFSLGEHLYEHEVGNPACGQGWCNGVYGNFPNACDEPDCIGLVHADFGDENGDGDYWVYEKCDQAETHGGQEQKDDDLDD